MKGKFRPFNVGYVYCLVNKVKVKVTLRLTVYRQSVRLGVKPLETHDQMKTPLLAVALL
jgi:hypothetical protein